MPVKKRKSRVLVHWFNEEKTIIRQIFKIRYTLEEYLESVEETHALLDSVAPQRVHIISQFSPHFSFPIGLLASLRHISLQVRANEGLHLIIHESRRAGSGSLLLEIYDMGLKFAKHGENQRVLIVHSMEEALERIKNYIDPRCS